MNDIEAGSTLTESLAKHPKAWDELYVNMVNAGETGGILDTILMRLAECIEKIEEYRNLGISELVLQFPSLGAGDMKGVELFAETVIPAFR